MKQLLLIEDDAIMGESLLQRFELEGYALHWCRSLREAAEALARTDRGWCAVISDVRLPDGLASAWYQGLSPAQRQLPWFFLTGYGSVNDALATVRAGAREYLTKPFDIEHLVGLVHQAVADPEVDGVAPLLGVSPVMQRIEALARKLAVQRVSVLISGESGVGKEIVAQLIHQLGLGIAGGRFVAVNCAAIPETLMESEFFGHERGAFSGAARQHKGYLEQADGGTLFLDEIGELPPAMQAKLLRALQEKAFFRVGSERPTRSEFRVLAATNRDLQAEMRTGHFREDLYYRLAVLRIGIPPLRERIEDIRWLAQRFASQYAQEQGRPVAMSDAYLRSLQLRPWPGNARELRSHLEEALILSEAGILDAGEASAGTDLESADDLALLPLQAAIEETERRHIQSALRRTAGTVGKAAELLGISRKTLWERMRRYGIQ